MSQHTKSLTRRKFLKGAAYVSALSVGGVSSLAFATSNNKPSLANSSSVTLLNHSNKTVVLNASQPVSLENVNGWVVAVINKASDQNIVNARRGQLITLRPGQKRAFAVDVQLASKLKKGDDQIVITNEYSAMSSMVPIFTYDEQLA
jgi:hypothetical protein